MGLALYKSMETRTPLLKDARKSTLSMQEIVTNNQRHTNSRFFSDENMRVHGTRLCHAVYTNGKGLHFFVTSEKRGTIIPGNVVHREYHCLWYDENTHKVNHCYDPKDSLPRTTYTRLYPVFGTQRQAESEIKAYAVGLTPFSQD
jgi:hypothetical protein